jgi:2-C-methyl-D-erythritol 4-phosphate cytidylyltransferase
MNRFVIIVAGGSGQRMGSTIPKQFLNIHKEVILMKSISAFRLFDLAIQIVLALPEHHIAYWNELCNKNNFKIEHSVVPGGKTRYHSVKNALEAINTDGIVAIHDGVRPLVSQETIAQVFDVAARNGNAVPYIDLVDSIRFVHNGINEPADRNQFKLIQTPQAFDTKSLKEAYKQDWEENFTDDASVVEKLGIKINLVPGNRENIKITSQLDLKIAETLSSYPPE